ncbi:MAG: DNA polymerase III subunit delta [bacterium]|nr:DNA polymerase III subunit delta [Gammaproteobacteria bacterium]HIL97612.1 DNA polymerase III subunit delta [Pseudomonadales bacterium]
MKVYPEKLVAQLSRHAAPIYIVSGDEPLLVQESCDLIRENLRTRGFTERELFHVEGSFKWEEVLFSANSMSLFAEQKLLELRIPGGKPGTQGAKALLTFIENPTADTVMLVVLPRLDANSQRSKWFKSLESAGMFVQVWPIEVAQLPGWINERFRKVGLNASRDAVMALIERIEGNLLAAVQEIERIRLIVPDNTVDVDLIVEGVSDSARYDVFGLIDASVGQDAARSVKIVRGLCTENNDILYISAMVARELRSLVVMAHAVSRGQNIDTVIKSNRIWQKRRATVRLCLQRQKPDLLQQCLRQLGKIDRQVKGIQQGNPWDELESLMLRLAGVT